MSDQVVVIKCKHCSKNSEYNRVKLATMWGSTVDITCKICKQQNRLTVNAVLMSGKTPVENKVTDPITEILEKDKPNIQSYQIAKLHVLAGENTSAQSFELKEGEQIVGRQSADDIGIVNKIRIITNDTKMSRSHCQITVTKKADNSYQYVLSDLESANGTHVQNALGSKKLEINEKVVIQVGDIVGLGYRTQIKLDI